MATLRVTDPKAEGGIDVFESVWLEVGKRYLGSSGTRSYRHTQRDHDNGVRVIAMQSQQDDMCVAWLCVQVFDDHLFLASAWVEPDYRQSGMFTAMFEHLIEQYPHMQLRGMYLSDHVRRVAEAHNEQIGKPGLGEIHVEDHGTANIEL